jgi:hypothetical protein
LDLHEHGISAYPEYVISSMGRPGGMISKEPGKPITEAATQFSVMEPMV